MEYYSKIKKATGFQTVYYALINTFSISLVTVCFKKECLGIQVKTTKIKENKKLWLRIEVVRKSGVKMTYVFLNVCSECFHYIGSVIFLPLPINSPLKQFQVCKQCEKYLPVT